MGPVVAAILSGLLGGLVWQLLIKRRYPRIAAVVDARRGKRPILFTLASAAWGVAGVMALALSVLAFRQPAVSHSRAEVAEVAGLLMMFAAVAALLTRKWWRTTRPSR